MNNDLEEKRHKSHPSFMGPTWVLWGTEEYGIAFKWIVGGDY